MRHVVFLALLCIIVARYARAEDGSAAWLRYPKVGDAAVLAAYRANISEIVVSGDSPVLGAARDELRRGLSGLLGQDVPVRNAVTRGGAVVVDAAGGAGIPVDGYAITAEIVADRRMIRVTSGSGRGALYGVFALLRRMQQHLPIRDWTARDYPRVPIRMVDQWDNLDGSVERGYGGRSIFWSDPPDAVARQKDYARLLASVGVSAICINNVNADPRILTGEYIRKTGEIADVYRPWGIRVFVAVNFKSPERVGGLNTSDPLDPHVRKWWHDKADEIYRAIPDFGGWVVKADSEGQPGPYAYGRSHADGANTLAAALKPHGGLVFWRAFVYAVKPDEDRARMAYDAFHPLDGKFAGNVVVQVKNGPLDFQVREPVHPLFGAMPATNMALEVQIAQEYTGQDVDLCWLVPEWKKTLDFDTHCAGPGSTVRRVVDGSLFHQAHAAMVGVANVGADANWMGNHLAVANLYGFGRLAWNPELSPDEIAREWSRLTFGNDAAVVGTVSRMLLASHDVFEQYTSPFGLNVLAGRDHFNPDPAARVSYHHGDANGVGYDRTVATGSGYAGQYDPPVARQFENVETTPDNLLLFFHHVPYSHRLHDGRTVLEAIVEDHDEGVKGVENLRARWRSLKGSVDKERYAAILTRFDEQVRHARVWRDAVNGYFKGLAAGRSDGHPE